MRHSESFKALLKEYPTKYYILRFGRAAALGESLTNLLTACSVLKADVLRTPDARASVLALSCHIINNAQLGDTPL